MSHSIFFLDLFFTVFDLLCLFSVSSLPTVGANVNGCDPRGEWQTPLFLAAENGKSEIIELLLEQCPPGSSSAARHDGDRRTFAPPTDRSKCDLDFAR
jgi:ankyrin repeat protein